jgi:hypothetical protein
LLVPITYLALSEFFSQQSSKPTEQLIALLIEESTLALDKLTTHVYETLSDMEDLPGLETEIRSMIGQIGKRKHYGIDTGSKLLNFR